MDHSTVIAVAGAKGGVGKTTSSINLGVALRERGLDVAVVELDLAMANVVDFLSLPFDEDADPTMHDVLAGEVPVTDVLVTAPGDVAVAPSGTALAGLDDIDIGRLPAVLTALAEAFDVVVVDTAAGMNSATTAAINAADHTILVSTPRVASLRDANKTQTLVERADGDVAGLLLTKGGPGTAPESRRLADFLDADLLGSIPKSSAVPASQDAGVPIVERRPDDPVSEAYCEAATMLADALGLAAPEPPEDERHRDETAAAGPSKADLEAEGWTFPGANEEADRNTESTVETGAAEPSAEPAVEEEQPDQHSETVAEEDIDESSADADEERTDERTVDREAVDETDASDEQTDEPPDLIGRVAAGIQDDRTADDDGADRTATEERSEGRNDDRDPLFESDVGPRDDEPRGSGEGDDNDDEDASESSDDNDEDANGSNDRSEPSEAGRRESDEHSDDDPDERTDGGERSANDEEETASISGRLSAFLRRSG